MEPENDEPRDLIDRVAEELRAPMAGTSAPVDAIMRLVAREAPPRRPAIGRIGPVWRVAALTGLAAALVLGIVRLTETGEARPQSTAQVDGTGSHRVVRFALNIPEARQVTLVGDFNGWNPAGTALARSSSGGRWSVTLTLPPGHYHYLFLVDGQRWLADPAMPQEPNADFGSPDSIITVL